MERGWRDTAKCGTRPTITVFSSETALEHAVLGCLEMPTEPRLDPIVDTHAPLIGRVRKRAALATGFLLGVSGAGALLMVTRPTTETETPIVFTPPMAITIPPPIVVTIEQAAPVVPAVPAANAGLDCPRIATEDLPIGKAISLARTSSDEGSPATAVAAANAPQLAVLADHRVWVSDDDGRSFQETFTGHHVRAIAMDRNGVLYAQGASELGVRPPRGKVTWRERSLPECGSDCPAALGVLGDEVVWIQDTQVATSRDRGRTWNEVDTSDYAWATMGRLLPWRGSLYQVQIYQDMCGVDDTHVHRLDANHRIAHSIFANYYTVDGSVLVADNESEATWTWRERCWTEDESHRVGRCSTKSATRANLLTAGTLYPVEGARTLSVWNQSLVELCGTGARQVYRQFPFNQIDAVDHAGRAVVMHQNELLRWSPVHGWRMLFTLPVES